MMVSLAVHVIHILVLRPDISLTIHMQDGHTDQILLAPGLQQVGCNSSYPNTISNKVIINYRSLYSSIDMKTCICLLLRVGKCLPFGHYDIVFVNARG